MTLFDEEAYHITSVSKFLEIREIQKLMTSNWCPGKWIFRGESNFNYLLKPSVGRLFGKEPFIIKEHLLKFEEAAFKEFTILAYNELRISNPFIVLAVAQHHGLRTRLLDWSFSPLVALFFAVEDDRGLADDGALIVCQLENELNNFPEKSGPFANNLEDYHYVFVPSISPRIKAQRAVFQLFKDLTEEFLEGFKLRKFRIPALSKEKIKRELEVLGISYESIFPDLDGLCKTINYNKLRNK